MSATEERLTHAIYELVECLAAIVALPQGKDSYRDAVRHMIARLEAALAQREEAPLHWSDAHLPKLTLRQVEVLRHLRNGLAPCEIARMLSLSETTVRTHIRDASERLHVHRWFDAVAEAERRGLLP